MGRFQKPDSNFDSPIANPQGWNLYSYVKGNPVNFNDPTGHMPEIPDRPEKPARPYGMMGGLMMGVNGSVEDQVRQAIKAAEATVNALITNNGQAGSITVSAEFLNKLKTDNTFRTGFTAWLATGIGMAQWNIMRKDSDTKYKFEVGPVPYGSILRGFKNAASGTGPTPSPLRWGDKPVVNEENVTITLDPHFFEANYASASQRAGMYAKSFGREALYATSIGGGRSFTGWSKMTDELESETTHGWWANRIAGEARYAREIQPVAEALGIDVPGPDD